MNTVYLIHFEKKFYHCQHYLGWTVDLEQRIKLHRSGNGARLLRAINLLGISYEVVRTWNGDYHLERKLKKRKKSNRLCPICIDNRHTFLTLDKHINK